jgi:hypothetical protein
MMPSKYDAWLGGLLQPVAHAAFARVGPNQQTTKGWNTAGD